MSSPSLSHQSSVWAPRVSRWEVCSDAARQWRLGVSESEHGPEQLGKKRQETRKTALRRMVNSSLSPNADTC